MHKKKFSCLLIAALCAPFFIGSAFSMLKRSSGCEVEKEVNSMGLEEFVEQMEEVIDEIPGPYMPPTYRHLLEEFTHQRSLSNDKRNPLYLDMEHDRVGPEEAVALTKNPDLLTSFINKSTYQELEALGLIFSPEDVSQTRLYQWTNHAAPLQLRIGSKKFLKTAQEETTVPEYLSSMLSNAAFAVSFDDDGTPSATTVHNGALTKVPSVPPGHYVWIYNREGMLILQPYSDSGHPKASNAAYLVRAAGELHVKDDGEWEVSNESGTYKTQLDLTPFKKLHQAGKLVAKEYHP